MRTESGGYLREFAQRVEVDTKEVRIIGDALINFAPYGFTFLPAKYCSNQKQMRQSLGKLLAYKAERMFFAHGLPILSAASERLRGLLESPNG